MFCSAAEQTCNTPMAFSERCRLTTPSEEIAGGSTRIFLYLQHLRKKRNPLKCPPFFPLLLLNVFGFFFFGFFVFLFVCFVFFLHRILKPFTQMFSQCEQLILNSTLQSLVKKLVFSGSKTTNANLLLLLLL